MMEHGAAGRQRIRECLAEAISRAHIFLAASQAENGRWLDFRSDQSISSQWVTGYVGSHLGRAGCSKLMLDKARKWLLHNRHPAGGWAFSMANPPDADSIANVVHLLWQTRDTETSDAAIVEAVALLFQFWVESEGGFQTYRLSTESVLYAEGSAWCDVHLSVTAMAAQALYLVDRDRHRPVLEACSRLIRAWQTPAGLWEDYWWDGRTYGTYHAARLLSMIGDDAAVRRAGDCLIGLCSSDGGWGNCAGGQPAPFHTALAVGTLLLHEEHRHSDAARDGISWLLRAQRPDGSWPAVAALRMPYPHIHTPWDDPHGCLLYPLLVDGNRVFTTATVLPILVEYSQARDG